MNSFSDWSVIGVSVAVVFAAAVIGYYVGLKSGVSGTVEISQRAAILAGAAKWVANKETGSPEFAWVQCTALGVTR
jgi:hypothetical protein